MEYLRLEEFNVRLLMDKGWSLGEYVECLVVEGRGLVVVFRIRLLSSCAQVKD